MSKISNYPFINYSYTHKWSNTTAMVVVVVAALVLVIVVISTIRIVAVPITVY